MFMFHCGKMDIYMIFIDDLKRQDHEDDRIIATGV